MEQNPPPNIWGRNLKFDQKGGVFLITMFPHQEPGFPIYYVPSSRTVSKGTPLEEFVLIASKGVFLHTVHDEGI